MKRVYRLYKTFYEIESSAAELAPNRNAEIYNDVNAGFVKAMDNDFNTALVIAELFQYMSMLNQSVSERRFQEALDLQTAMKDTYSVIGVCQLDPMQVMKHTKEKYLRNNGMTEEEILRLLEQRKRYKTEKDFGAADAIRSHLTSHSIEVKDGKETVEWDLIIE